MYSMTIDGERAVSPKMASVINPATEESFAEAPECSKEQLDHAMTSASRALPTWGLAGESVRRKTLEVAADAIELGAERIAKTLTLEQGKPLRDARLEVGMTAALFREFSKLEVEWETVFREDETALVRLVRRPCGVVAAITPWNFPLALAARKISPALLAGNTVVLKPSPFTPLSTLLLGELLRDVFPAGVLNVVAGGADVGARMTAHWVPRRITFTGSIATGKAIASTAGADLKRVTLELGGNDPALVLEDADIERIAPKIFASAFANSGQVCSAIKRVYVPSALYEDMVAALAEEASSKRVGDGLDDKVDLGPVSNAPQFDRVMGIIEDARRHGAVIATGGQRLGDVGYFVQPTVVGGVSDGVRVVDEEQFGPVLPVVSYDDLDDAIDRANGSHFGLDASIWGTDHDRVSSVAARLECGTVWMNVHGARSLDQPTGGLKWSGIGLENGKWGFEEMTDLQVFYEARG
jgi:acyl-CoA reductase-like NAD-dependent aldehyde dehydrogenase